MADPAPEFVPDHELRSRLLHQALGVMVEGFQHLADVVPSAAGLRPMVANARRLLDLADEALVDPWFDPVPEHELTGENRDPPLNGEIAGADDEPAECDPHDR